MTIALGLRDLDIPSCGGNTFNQYILHQTIFMMIFVGNVYGRELYATRVLYLTGLINLSISGTCSFAATVFNSTPISDREPLIGSN